jgi:hypothetical protein
MSFLVVLGMHRCGTSSLTGTLNLLGFSAGNQLTPPNEFNARGYFEDIALNEELDQFLSVLNRSWRDERVYPSDWLSSDAALASAKKLKALFKADFNFNQPTVLKNPRVSRLLPLLQPIWLDAGLAPKYILSLRSPIAVIHSLARRDSILPQRAALLYVAHLLEVELNTRHASSLNMMTCCKTGERSSKKLNMNFLLIFSRRVRAALNALQRLTRLLLKS